MPTPDELLDTPEGLLLAHAAFREGVAVTLRAAKEADETGVFTKPQSPYWAAWNEKKREASDADTERPMHPATGVGAWAGTSNRTRVRVGP